MYSIQTIKELRIATFALVTASLIGATTAVTSASVLWVINDALTAEVPTELIDGQYS